MTLEILWFCLLAFFWTAYFVLEGFDFGVGMLLPVLGRSEADRSTMFESIGPLWDGNEVWLVIAGGATFAAFPVWYATMFSGFYLALLLILALLIVRVLSFEWRGKAESPGWKAFWAWMNTIGSIGAPLLWGIALASLLHGVPIASDQTYAGDFGDLFSAYTILAGIAVCLLFALHGAVFLTLRTLGDLRERARLTASRLAPAAAVVGAGFLVWTLVVAGDVNDKGVFPGILPVAVAAVAVVAAVFLVRAANERWAFVATATAIGAVVVTLFVSLYPRVMVSDPDFANSLTVENASSAHYSLTVMTVVAAVLLPVVLLYQAWTYHVFRARLGGEDAGSPVDLVARKTGGRTPWERSTRACCAERGPCASCSAPTRCSACSPRCFVLAQAALLAHVAARALRRRLARGPRPAARAPASPPPLGVRRPRGASRSQAGGRRRTCSRSFGSTSSSGGSATGRRRSTAPRAPRSRRSRWPASTRSRQRSPATCRSSCSPRSSLSRYSRSSPRSTSISAGVMLLTLPLVPVFMWLVGRYTERRTRERWQALARLATHFIDVVRGLPTLRAFNRAEAQAERIAQVSDEYRRTTMGTLRVAFLSGTVLELAATLGIALVAVTVGVRLVEGGLGFEAGLTVLVLAPELYLPLRNLAAQYHASADGLAVAERLLDLLEERPTAVSGRRARRRARATFRCGSRASPSPTRRARAWCSTRSTSSSRPARRSRSSARAGAERARSPRSSSASPSPPAAA